MRKLATSVIIVLLIAHLGCAGKMYKPAVNIEPIKVELARLIQTNNALIEFWNDNQEWISPELWNDVLMPLHNGIADKLEDAKILLESDNGDLAKNVEVAQALISEARDLLVKANMAKNEFIEWFRANVKKVKETKDEVNDRRPDNSTVCYRLRDRLSKETKGYMGR